MPSKKNPDQERSWDVTEVRKVHSTPGSADEIDLRNWAGAFVFPPATLASSKYSVYVKRTKDDSYEQGYDSDGTALEITFNAPAVGGGGYAMPPGLFGAHIVVLVPDDGDDDDDEVEVQFKS